MITDAICDRLSPAARQHTATLFADCAYLQIQPVAEAIRVTARHPDDPTALLPLLPRWETAWLEWTLPPYAHLGGPSPALGIAWSGPAAVLSQHYPTGPDTLAALQKSGLAGDSRRWEGSAALLQLTYFLGSVPGGCLGSEVLPLDATGRPLPVRAQEDDSSFHVSLPVRAGHALPVRAGVTLAGICRQIFRVPALAALGCSTCPKVGFAQATIAPALQKRRTARGRIPVDAILTLHCPCATPFGRSAEACPLAALEAVGSR